MGGRARPQVFDPNITCRTGLCAVVVAGWQCEDFICSGGAGGSQAALGCVGSEVVRGMTRVEGRNRGRGKMQYCYAGVAYLEVGWVGCGNSICSVCNRHG